MTVAQTKAARHRIGQTPKAMRARRMALIVKPKPKGVKANNRR